MDQYEMIRTAHRVYGKTIRELAREYGHHRKTIRKILEGKEPKYRRTREPAEPVMEVVGDRIRGWLVEDKSNPKKQRHTARRIWKRLKEEAGFSGAESTVRRWVRRCKAELGLGRSESVIPLEPLLGGEAEVDWGRAWVIMGGERQEVRLFCMRSKYSGMAYVKAYPCERQEMFFDGHQSAFTFFGGVFPTLVYDNLTLAVRTVMRGKQRLEQARFVSFRSYHTFAARYCNPGKGNEKGGVEGLVGYARRNFLVPLPAVSDYEELNRLLSDRCAKDALRVLAGREDDRTVLERHEEEQARLLPLPAKPYENEKLATVKISRYQTAGVDRNRYSVPEAYVGRQLRVQVGCWRVRIYDGNRLVADHPRVFGNSKWQIDPLHYLRAIGEKVASFDSARAIRQWRKAWPTSYEAMLSGLQLRFGESKGKREFVRILQLHEGHPAAEVEGAVSEALEMGVLGYDGVKHLLRRKTNPGLSVEPLPMDLLPGVTDRRVGTSDVSRYGALLNGGWS
ncbi:MAG: IS21 family transposase [Acidobacteria bacterium]|nr:IS21 family transposase [Acidobacteriota bacterium]